MNLDLVLTVAALGCFLLATLRTQAAVDFTPLGLACLTLTLLF